MTKPDDSIDIASLALALVGEFSIVQESVDSLVAAYAKKRAPGLMRFLSDERVLQRIPDRARPRLVFDIAADLNSPSDLSRFNDVFYRVKATRDAIAHSVRSERVDADTLRLVRSHIAAVDGSRAEPVVLTRRELIARTNEARWLYQHVRYLFRPGGGICVATYVGARPIEPVQPPADPEDWDGVVLRFLDTEE